MKIFMHFRTNVNYMAYISDCLIEICNTQTITFGYQTHFFSPFSFELHLAWNVSDCLLWIWGPGVMMVNIATIVAPVNTHFPSSRNAALIERKVLQYTTLSKRLHYRTMIELKTQVFTSSDVLDCVSIPCTDQTTLKPGLFNKIYQYYIANMCWHSKWVPAGVQHRRSCEKLCFL